MHHHLLVSTSHCHFYNKVMKAQLVQADFKPVQTTGLKNTLVGSSGEFPLSKYWSQLTVLIIFTAAV